MSEFGIFTTLDGAPYDAINSFTSDYVVDVISTASGGNRTYPTSPYYNISAYIVNSPDSYGTGGQYDVLSVVSVTNGRVSWTANRPTTIVVVMRNV